MMYVVSYSTESGDRGVVGAFSERPGEGHLSAIAERNFPEEVVTCDGEPYKLVSFEVHAVDQVQPLPDPVEPIDGP